ncbi:MAG: nicotinamide mononucleotide transporter [Clostridia bacterium]|nr:nicotinamide mononucleotide transporter [Clostridia bacterium]
MKNWRGYTLLDAILLFSGIISVTIAGAIFKSQWYVIVQSILIILCVFTQAKGKISTQFIGVVSFCFYIYISYIQKYYGESILYLTIMLPMYIYGIVHWLRNKDNTNDVVIVKSNLSKIEWIVMSIGFILVSTIVYLLLKVLHTEELIISTLSFVTMLPAVYLLIRRCKWNQVAFLVNDFIVPLLWIMLVIKGDISFISMCITYIFQLTYDIYGLIEWIKLEKKQKADGITEK